MVRIFRPWTALDWTRKHEIQKGQNMKTKWDNSSSFAGQRSSLLPFANSHTHEGKKLPLPPTTLPSSTSYFLLMVLFQWFFMALSVLPGKSLAIFAHWLPTLRWASTIILSSASVHAVFLMPGFKWLCHLSRHCLPMRPFKCLAMRVHFLGPYLSTSSTTFSSSWNAETGH